MEDAASLSQRSLRLRAARRATIIRCPLILRKRMCGIWRFIAPCSFALASAPVALWQILRRRPDIVICIEPTLMVAPIALFAARLAGSRTVLHVQDLEVDACFAVTQFGQAAWLKKLPLPASARFCAASTA